MSQVQSANTASLARPEGQVPALRGDGSGVAQESPHAPMSTASKGSRVGSDPIEICLAGMSYGEAPRIGFVGDTGTGKSRAMRAVVAGWLARNPGVVLACDKGGSSGFDGQRRVNLSDLRLTPMLPEPRAVVFTGDLSSGLDPDAEAVAAFAWRLRATRTESLVVVDELKWCARAGFWQRRARWLPQTCTEGRKHGVGILWGVQFAQDAPREAIEEAGSLVVFRQAGLAVECLRRRNYLLGMPEGTLERLPGEETPPPARGRCVILRRGQQWDGRFHRFP